MLACLGHELGALGVVGQHALQDAGLELTMLVEHDTAPWNALPGQMERVGGDEWRLIERPERVAMTYTLQAVKAG